MSVAAGRAAGYSVGIKLVRGAYIVTETALATTRGYKRPVHADIQGTHDNYNACATELIVEAKAGGVKVCVDLSTVRMRCLEDVSISRRLWLATTRKV